MIPGFVIALVYLVAAALFIIGLKRLQSPLTARQGNMLSGVGMLLAILITLVDQAIVSYTVIAAGLLVGTGIGFWMARTVQMTAMPQMVALLNGFGGGASLLVAAAELLRAELAGAMIPAATSVTIQLALLIGAVTFSGSFIAWGKLQGVISGSPLTFPGQKLLNGALFAAVLGVAIFQIFTAEPHLWPLVAIVSLALVLGVMLVLPIGGADMPVVIALLNSYSGIAAAMTGFVINNYVLIIAGALVGSSGLILSQIMCKAMNRSLANVLFGAFGAADGAAGGGRSSDGLSVRQVSPEDAAIQLAYAQRVIVVPGYGLAVAQAQHQIRELADLIEKNGGEVRYAIHPVAGRMPGHMNVLLAEANVPYEKLRDMDEINADFAEADVALVVGANDVVNPAARSDPSSPIYGMPILNVDQARSTIVMKRSMNTGFAGVENDLFFADKTAMLFGDAKDSLSKLVGEVKGL